MPGAQQATIAGAPLQRQLLRQQPHLHRLRIPYHAFINRDTTEDTYHESVFDARATSLIPENYHIFHVDANWRVAMIEEYRTLI